MIDIHKLDIPFLFCIKNFKGLIFLLAQKIFNYGACLFCDTQKFDNYRSLQAHMIDKGHTRINDSDLDEHLYKFYDKIKLRSLKDPKWTKMREYKILSLRLKVAEKLKEKKKDKEEDEWEEEESDEEEKKEDKKEYKEDSDDDDFDPLILPNGELLLENGTVLGNKIYNLYYKQRIKLSRIEDLQKEISNIQANKRIVRKKLIKKKNMLVTRRKRNHKREDLNGKSGYQFLKLR